MTRPTVRRWPPGSPVSVSSLWSPHRNAFTSCLPRDGHDLTDSFPPRSRDRRVGAEGQRTTSPGTRGWQLGHGARVSESGGWPQTWNVGAEGESLPFLAVVLLSGASGHTDGLSPGKVPGPSPLSPGTLSRLCVWALRGPVKERGASPRQWLPGPQRPLPASPTERRVWIVLATLAQHLHQGACPGVGLAGQALSSSSSPSPGWGGGGEPQGWEGRLSSKSRSRLVLGLLGRGS